MIILGIDPGLVITGYGIIRVRNNNFELIDFGTIVPENNKPLSQRLNVIYEDVLYILNKYNPSVMAIEEVFFGKNVKSALLLGHARGVPYGGVEGVVMMTCSPLYICGRRMELQVQRVTLGSRPPWPPRRCAGALDCVLVFFLFSLIAGGGSIPARSETC